MTNICDDLPQHMSKEIVQTLIRAADVRIERIVSHGHACDMNHKRIIVNWKRELEIAELGMVTIAPSNRLHVQRIRATMVAMRRGSLSLSPIRLAGIAIAGAALVGVFFVASDDFSIFCAGVAIFIVCLAVPVLMNVKVEKEDFIDTFDRKEGQ